MWFFPGLCSQQAAKDLFHPVCYKMFCKVNELAEEIFVYKLVYMCAYACMQAGKKINRLVCINIRDEMVSLLIVVPCLYWEVKSKHTKHEIRFAFSNAGNC